MTQHEKDHGRGRDDDTPPARPGDEGEPGAPQTAENTCPACGGSGQTAGRACGECNGTGVVSVIVGDA